MATNSAQAGQQDIKNDALYQKIRELVPPLTGDRYKGQAGKVAVIGGCREYTGAPYFASYSALKVGADLSHVFCTEGAATVIKSYSPELIVHPYLPDTNDASHEVGEEEKRQSQQRAVDAIDKWLDKFDVVVVGPGLGRDDLILSTVAEVMGRVRRRNTPMVIDADGLWLVNQNPALVQGYPNAVLTPNAMEFKRLAGKLGVDPDSKDALQQVASRMEGPVIVRKGSADEVSDGLVTISCDEQGSLRRAGGQGDVLSGCISVFVAWTVRGAGVSKEQLHGAGGASAGSEAATGGDRGQKESAGAEEESIPPLLLAAYGGSLLTRLASRAAFQRHGRAMGATDLLAELGPVVSQHFDP
ncbi:hypothetical protein N2152v2_006296 [Parachlorella kessleri]